MIVRGGVRLRMCSDFRGVNKLMRGWLGWLLFGGLDWGVRT